MLVVVVRRREGRDEGVDRRCTEDDYEVMKRRRNKSEVVTRGT